MIRSHFSKRHARRLGSLALVLMAWGSWGVRPGHSSRQWVSSVGEPLPLNQRVLVVYHANVPESLEVARYYMARRDIPASHQCAITPPDTKSVGWGDFDSSVRGPIRDCLDAVGRDQILYIVFTYQTPYKLDQVPIDGGFEARSLDQYIADIWDESGPDDSAELAEHPYFAAAQSQGNFYPPFVSLADYRSQPTALTLYSVWRLDGATADLAKGLVDQAIEAEANGLRGQGCFDRNRGRLDDLPDWSYATADWDLHRAAEFARQAGLSVTEDDQEAEFGTPPAPLRCDDAALYAGWYAYDHYNDAFTWNPGAIGFHLDSASALDPRAGSNWAANALLRGITVTSGSVSEPYLEGLAHPDGVFRNLFEGANVGDAFFRNTAFVKWMVINLGDPLYRPYRGGIAPFNLASGAQASLALGPNFVVGGQASSGTVSLGSPAPAGDIVVGLAGTNPEVATFPSSLTVPEGQATATFAITTKVVTSYNPVVITASYGGWVISNTLGLAPLLASITLKPEFVTGGTATTGTVALNGPAPTGGVAITLASDNPMVATVPASLTIAEGAMSAKFNVTTSAVAGRTPVSISASLSGTTETATLIVLP